MMYWPRKKRRNLVSDALLDQLKAIPGFPGYYVSPDARVFSVAEMSQVLRDDGYLYVGCLKEPGVLFIKLCVVPTGGLHLQAIKFDISTERRTTILRRIWFGGPNKKTERTAVDMESRKAETTRTRN